MIISKISLSFIPRGLHDFRGGLLVVVFWLLSFSYAFMFLLIQDPDTKYGGLMVKIIRYTVELLVYSHLLNHCTGAAIKCIQRKWFNQKCKQKM